MNKEQLIEFLEIHASINFEPEEESTPVRGNAISSDNDATDKEVEDSIIRQLEQGNNAAWFCAKVTATYDNFHGTDYLGCCSYASFEDFEQGDGYYPDMIATAIDDLASQILQRKYDLEKIEEKIIGNDC